MARLVDILIVDDRAVDADVTILALKYAAPTARVLRLKNGAEALSYLFGLDRFAGPSPSLPGLVVLDAQMPVMSGACLLEVLRGHPATRDIPVVLVCTDGESLVVRRSDEFAADAYLQRPPDLDSYASVLARTMEHCLPRVVRSRVREPRRSLMDGAALGD